MSDRRQVKVVCSIPNGLTIHLSQPGHDDGTGVRHQVGSQEITLKCPPSFGTGVNNSAGLDQEPPFTTVDEEAMLQWLDQNAKNPIVTSGSVYIVKEDEPEAEAKEPEAPAGDDLGEGSGAPETETQFPPGHESVKEPEGDEKTKPFDAALAESRGGYQKGDVVASVVLPGVDWISTIDGNMTDPDSADAEGWDERPEAEADKDEPETE